MAGIDQVEDAWRTLTDAGLADSTIPVTCRNSSAAIKAFTRPRDRLRLEGNAETSLRWAFENGRRVLFPAGSAPRPQYSGDEAGTLAR